MTISVQFPAMRDQVIAALRSLANPEHQRTHWGLSKPEVNYYDDLTLNVHILYDDCQILPDPSAAVGTVLIEGEVEAIRRVHGALGPILDELGDRPDSDYLDDPGWPAVALAAQKALETMRQYE
jgi:hypothetical protein